MPKQQEIPGTERRTIPEIDEKATVLHEIVQRRLSIQKQEKQAHAALIEEMKAHGLDNYKFQGDDGREMSVKIKIDQKASVRLAKNAAEDDGEDGEEGSDGRPN